MINTQNEKRAKGPKAPWQSQCEIHKKEKKMKLTKPTKLVFLFVDNHTHCLQKISYHIGSSIHV
jgi:hypothetical protein